MGRPLGSKNKDRLSLKDRIFSKIEVNKTNGCWEMKLTKYHRYPQIQIGKKSVRAHRVSFEIFNDKKIPPDKFCLHKCDNTKCVNPEHLFLGTLRENMQDMIKKGRNRYNPPVGIRCAQHKLNENQVLEIRKLFKKGMNQAELSKKYKVHNVTIHYIVKNKTWKHII